MKRPTLLLEMPEDSPIVRWLGMADEERRNIEGVILNQLISLVHQHAAAFREDITGWWDEKSAEQKIRELVAFREKLSYEAFEDNTESERRTAVVAEKALRRIKATMAEIPDDVHRRIAHYHGEAGSMFSRETLHRIDVALAFFERRAAGSRGRPSNLLLDRTVSRCVQTITEITGKRFVRNLQSIDENDVTTFLHPHAMICEMVLRELDPHLDHNIVKGALKRYFQKNIHKKKPSSVRFPR